MKNKKIITAVAFVVILGLMAGIYFATRPQTVEGDKTITVTVVHKDGTTKDFVCNTSEEYLGPVLVSENIVVGSQGQFGLYFDTADGEKADYNVDQGWWAIYVGQEQATTGADGIAIVDGGVYKLVYTIG